MYTISTQTICSECSEKRARAVVAQMNKLGYANVQYGETSILPHNGRDPVFSETFYKALDIVDFNQVTPAPR